MENKTWDFSKIPLEKHKAIVELFDNEDWMALKDIHDLYRLSSYNYTCCGGSGVNEAGIKNWFKYGITNNFIKRNNAGTIKIEDSKVLG